MSGQLRLLAVALLLGAGVLLVFGLFTKGNPFLTGPTLAPAFQLLGRVTKTADRMVGRVLPVSQLDERHLGTVLAARYQAKTRRYDGDLAYVNDLVNHLRPYTKRHFPYQAFILESSGANAMALPGGVVLVTRGLLQTLHSEAELVAVLAHELGHIELGHCFDSVKFQLLAKKVGAAALGKLADFATDLLFRHSFSKTQENEADEYAFTLLTHSPYDPRGVALAFQSLNQQHQGVTKTAAKPSLQPWRDYIRSHPPLKIRITTFQEKALNWWRGHPHEKRYLGKQNLKERKSFYSGVQWRKERVSPSTTRFH